MSAGVLYTPEVLALATSLAGFPWDESLPLKAEARSRSCGSSIALAVGTDTSGIVRSIGLRSHACAIGQASAAIMARHAVGADRATLEAAKAELEAILAGDGPEQTIWRELEVMRPVRDFRARHAAALLPFRAVLQAYDQAAAKMKAG